MNIKRFHAATSREAMAKARMAFGDGALILSNRSTPNGVEVVATAEEHLQQMDSADQPSSQLRARTQASEPPRFARPATPVQQDTEELAMSTLSFQDYVRERMLRKRHEELHGAAATPANAPRKSEPRATVAASESPRSVAPLKPQRTEARTAFSDDAPAPASARSVSHPPPLFAEPAQVSQQGIVSELQAMKNMIEERFNTLAWLGQARQNPIHSNLMIKLIRAGYSPGVSRAVLERMPEDMDASGAIHWVMNVLERNLKTDAGQAALYEQGGIYALIGATGVGKTTTTAKLAALCARLHGASSVGLITLDTYRIAAHEQLRTYGRMMGVVAHLAHDRAALQDLLNLLANKKMVLIDTTGLAPRDPRTREMLNVLDLPKINRLVVLNAGSHGDTLDETLTSFKSHGIHGGILSKTDEAVKLGPALDASIRHQLLLRGVTQGQRVPEDWERADAGKLVKLSMRSPGKSAFDPSNADLGFYFAQASDQPMSGASLHA